VAHQVLISASALSEKCPEWYGTMLYIGRGLGWDRDDFMKVFHTATKFEPEYGSLYTELTTYFQPRWYGEEGEWASVLMDETARGTEASDAMFQRIFEITHQTYYEYKDIAPDVKKYWSRIKRGFHAREKLYGVTDNDVNDFARMAYMVEDLEEAHAVFPRLENHEDMYVWDKDQKLLDRAKFWAS